MDHHDKFGFLTEKVKDRPVNKKKLIRKMIMTVASAVVFGLIVCFTIAVLQPVINNWLHPQEKIETIEIPVAEDEILPEEMVEHEQQILEPSQEVIDTLKSEIHLGISDYQELYGSIYEVVQTLKSAMVTVTGVSSDVDWLNDPYESFVHSTGYIFADNNAEILIFVEADAVLEEEKIEVTFFDERKVTAYIKGIDYNTGLAVVAVSKESLVASTQNAVTYLSLGSSGSDNLLGKPVIALGNPLGKASVMYGMITSENSVISMVDMGFELITTDIYGSSEGEGILVDLKGNVLGIIYQGVNEEEQKNRISALGITQLKPILQRMANGFEHAYIGIEGTDVPKKIHEIKSVPMGAYVTGIILDSPAMEAGIQSGDVIVQIGKNSISSMADYRNAIMESKPGEVKEITLMRQSAEGYISAVVTVTIGELQEMVEP